MEKFKAKQLARLKGQKDGWKKAFQLISQKYKPSLKVEDIQRLLKDCGSGTVNFIDRPVDAETADKLNAISKKCSIECKVQGRTTRQYYTLAKEQLEHVSKEYDEFEINYKKRQKKRRGISLLVAGVIVVLTCSFIYLDGPKYLQAEKYMNEGKYEEALNLYSQCKNNVDAKQKTEEAKYQIAEVYMHEENYEAALEWYSKCEDYLDAKEKGAEAEYQIAEAYMRDRNYEAALERYSQCENYLDVKEKEAEARYQIAEAYMQDEKYSDAVEWYTQCGDYRDAENKAERAKRKIKEETLQSLGLDVNANFPEFDLVSELVNNGICSYSDIYTLGNIVPCGLVKYHISYKEFANLKDFSKRYDRVNRASHWTLTDSGHSLYGYDCKIEYSFDDNDFLEKISVVGLYELGVISFTNSDIERVGSEIEQELGVSPEIESVEEEWLYEWRSKPYNYTKYTFISDGVKYYMDTYIYETRVEKENQFTLEISMED